MQLSLVPSNAPVYNKIVQTFLDFCAEYSWRSSWPVTVFIVIHFVIFFHGTGLWPANIANRLAAVSFSFKPGLISGSGGPYKGGLMAALELWTLAGLSLLRSCLCLLIYLLDF